MALDRNYQSLVDRFGTPSGGGRPDENELARLGHRVPPALVEFWHVHGYGQVLDGYFSFCDPAKYQPIIDMVFEGDAQFEPEDITAVGMSAFGQLLLWHTIYHTLYASLVDLTLSCETTRSGRLTSNADLILFADLAGIDEDIHDEFDRNGNRLFVQALSRHGPLPPDHIYGFRPALAFGGAPLVENLAVYDAPVHLSILAQLDSLTLIDTVRR